MTEFKWVISVDNPHVPTQTQYLGVTGDFRMATIAIITDADMHGHEHVVALIQEADLNELEAAAQAVPPNAAFGYLGEGVLFDNGDGVTYLIMPVWDIDNN